MLQFDPAQAVTHLCSADRRLAKVIGRVGDFTLRPPPKISPFGMLLRAIVSQQLSMKAAETIHGRVEALLPPRNCERPRAILELPGDVLRGCGMSRAKVASVKDLAAKVVDGTVPPLASLRRMRDEEIVQRLTAIRGIGVWSVEMLLIFKLGRPDVLPIADLGVRKGFMRAFGRKALPLPGELIEHGERWRPFRSVASWYLWRVLEL